MVKKRSKKKVRIKPLGKIKKETQKTLQKIGKEVLHTRDMIAKHSVQVTDQITKSVDNFLFSITQIWKNHLEVEAFEKETDLKYGTIMKTKSGIEVKSKGEKMIADLLTKKKIEFEYEKKWKEGLYRRFKVKLVYLYPSQVENQKFEETFDYKLGYVLRV